MVKQWSAPLIVLTNKELESHQTFGRHVSESTESFDIQSKGIHGRSVFFLGFGEAEVFAQKVGAGKGTQVYFDAVVEVGLPTPGAVNGFFPRSENAKIVLAAFASGVRALLEEFKLHIVCFHFLGEEEEVDAVAFLAVLAGLGGFAAQGGDAVTNMDAPKFSQRIGIESMSMDDAGEPRLVARLTAGQMPEDWALLI